MALSEQRKQELFEVLDRTSLRPKNAPPPEYPQECIDFLKLADEEIITRTVDGFDYKLYIYRAKKRTPNCPIHINIHGGGFVGPHAPCDSMFSSYVADQIGGIVVDLDYTTSREAQWPVAFDQCYDACRYTFEQCAAWGGDQNRISAGGYSAGGSLVAGIALKAAETGDFSLCLQVLGYPPLDNILNPVYKRGGLKRVLPAERERAFTELYFGDDEVAKASPYGSPSYATDDQLRRLPRALVITAGGCNFRYEDEEYAMRMAGLGVEVTLKRFPDTSHGFIPHFGKDWREAADLIVRSIRSACNG